MQARYRLLSVFSILATGPLRCLATPIAQRWDKMTVHHAWDAVPENWESRGHPPADTAIDLYLALKSHKGDTLVAYTLYQVSDPSNLKYGKHLSKEEVAELIAPHPDTLKLVNSWLEDHSIPSSSVSPALGGAWLMATGMPVAQANDILRASYQLYYHVESNDTVLRTVSYSLPLALHGHIQTVAPTTYFGSPRTWWKSRHMHPNEVAAVRKEVRLGKPVAVLPSRQQELVTPSYLRLLYHTMGYVPTALEQSSLATAGYDRQYPSPQDLRTFMEEYRTDGEDATCIVLRVNGGEYNSATPGIEANLNLQYAEAMTYPTVNIYYSTGGTQLTDSDPYLRWLDYLLEGEYIPQTISTTYGGYEHEFPKNYAESVCRGFLILGLRGVSVLFGSGDWSVGQGDCLFEDSFGNVGVHSLPIFPASCPWVTAVGGTTEHNPEIAADLSGGGFSTYFERPDYQANAVRAYIHSLGHLYEGFYEPYGRGYPDLAAQAPDFLIVSSGEFSARAGTSCSTPTVAGIISIISLLNDYRISQGKNPLGFLNLRLYGDLLPGLNNIEIGSNPSCNTIGFPAAVGWDPVTGLGSPDFDRLEEIFDDEQ